MAHEQMRDFLKFFQSKRAVQGSEIAAIFEEFEESTLNDDIISKDDLVPDLNRLMAEVKDSVLRAMEQHTQMAGLVVEQILRDGHSKGVTLEFDMSKSEDEALLAEVGNLRLSDSKESEGLRAGVKLDSIRDEHARLVKECDRLAEENKALKERNQSVMRQATETTALKNELQAQLEAATAAAERAAKAGGESTAAETAKAKALEATVADLRSQLADAEAAAKSAASGAGAKAGAGSFAKSKQFAQLKSVLSKKNAQLAALRARLNKYEPDDVEDADADAPLK